MNSYGTQMVVLSAGIMLTLTILGYFFGKKKISRADDYFTAGRSITTAFMTATFIAYAVGTGLIFSPAEMAYYEGLTAMIGYGLAISLAYVFFIPVAGKIKDRIPNGTTIGQYAKVRYGEGMHLVVVAVTAVYMLCLLTANFIGVGIVFQYIGGVPIQVGILIVAVPALIYTLVGGLRSALFIAGIQALLITPLLFITGLLAFNEVGGPSGIFEQVMANSPVSLEIFRPSGVQFAALIIVAVVSAELLNQALWQRVYAAKSKAVVKKSLISAAIMTFPMAIVAASFGLIALALNMDLPHPSIATALVSNELLPRWGSLLFIVLVVLGATSTSADALSAFSSIASQDIIKTFMPKMQPKTAVRVGRLGLLIFGSLAMLWAFQAPSILKVLLLADLGASATVVPIVAGLYEKRISGRVAALGTLTGIIGGLPLFLSGRTFESFVAALLLSSFIVLVVGRFGKKEFDFERLKEDIVAID